MSKFILVRRATRPQSVSLTPSLKKETKKSTGSLSKCRPPLLRRQEYKALAMQTKKNIDEAIKALTDELKRMSGRIIDGDHQVSEKLNKEREAYMIHFSPTKVNGGKCNKKKVFS